MIIKFKMYENQKGKPEMGDFVLLKLDLYPHADNELIDDNDVEEIEKCIGYINYIDPNDGYTKYNISLDSEDERIRNMDLWVDRDEIVYFSEYKEKLEMIKNVEKYNL